MINFGKTNSIEQKNYLIGNEISRTSNEFIIYDNLIRQKMKNLLMFMG